MKHRIGTIQGGSNGKLTNGKAKVEISFQGKRLSFGPSKY